TMPSLLTLTTAGCGNHSNHAPTPPPTTRHPTSAKPVTASMARPNPDPPDFSFTFFFLAGRVSGSSLSSGSTSFFFFFTGGASDSDSFAFDLDSLLDLAEGRVWIALSSLFFAESFGNAMGLSHCSHRTFLPRNSSSKVLMALHAGHLMRNDIGWLHGLF